MTQMNTDGEQDPRTRVIIGAALEVHNELGHGFLEAVYQEALAAEFALREVPYVREAEFAVQYKGAVLGCGFRIDFVCFDDVIVELKALRELTGVEQAQTLNYLRVTGHTVGLLINFGAPRLEVKRLRFDAALCGRRT
ncbi:MAG: GxxExxY protein [Phycisphaerales bacterium JB039]